MSELIVDWPCKPSLVRLVSKKNNDHPIYKSKEEKRSSRVRFVLEKNTIHPIYKSKEEKRASWDTKVEKSKFKKNALRDIAFLRKLRSSKKDVDPSLYEDRVCSWGLETGISRTDKEQIVMIKNYVHKSVLLMQEIQANNGTRDENLIALMLRDASKVLQVRAQKIGLHYEDEVRKMSHS